MVVRWKSAPQAAPSKRQSNLLVSSLEELGAAAERDAGLRVTRELVQRPPEGEERFGALIRIVDEVQCPLEPAQ